VLVAGDEDGVAVAVQFWVGTLVSTATIMSVDEQFSVAIVDTAVRWFGLVNVE
jgi:hypothetical protein